MRHRAHRPSRSVASGQLGRAGLRVRDVDLLRPDRRDRRPGLPPDADELQIASLRLSGPALPKLEWITTDQLRGLAPDDFRNDPGEVLFLQYTSGSTSDPKGVIISHANVIHNGFATLDRAETTVSWLPQYHDMGLIGYDFYPLLVGGTNYGFSPINFLERPALWLQTISRVKATWTSAPNFGDEYCLREDELPDEQLEGVDLGSLRVMMNAAEPVRAETFRRFLERFAPCGLRPEAYVVFHGLAENTIAVTRDGTQIPTVNKSQLQRRLLHVENGLPRNNNQLEIVSCGKPMDGVAVRVVDPETCGALGEHQIGEIWVAGGGRAQGYWNRPELNREAFGGRVAGDFTDANVYPRTGDLGFFHEGEPFVLVPHGAISKTTSGKISRSRTRERWLAGELTGFRDRFQYIVELYNLTGREEYTFAEIGIDSLTTVQLLDDIKKLLEEHGAGSLVNEADVRLLQRLTVAEFFSLLEQFEKAADEPLLALRYVLRRVQKEHEDYERECMRSDAELDMPRIELDPHRTPLKNVLLTGATGFFGPFLLAGLLRDTPFTHHILTRATDPVHGLDRIRAALRRHRLWSPAIEEQLEGRVRILCGDLARHNLGLRSEQWKALTRDVDAVMHNGALVNYLLGYDALRAHNVDGTRELLRLAATGVQKEFHLVSSTFIFGWTPKGVLMETGHNAEMANLDFGYSQSKWVAEQLVYAAGRLGMRVRIYRPSLISAATNGAGGRDDIAVRLLAFMIKYGVAVNARNRISFLPAGIAADNIVSIFKQRETPATTFHVTVDDYYSMIDVTRVITRDYGYPFEYFEIP
nr:thioester reductase domain-containing protein [Acidobacteriota bacterium]